MKTTPRNKAKIKKLDEQIQFDLRFAYEAIEDQMTELEEDVLVARDNLHAVVDSSSPLVQKQISTLEEALRRQRQRLVGIQKSLRQVHKMRRQLFARLGRDEDAPALTASSPTDPTHGIPEAKLPTPAEAERVRHSPTRNLKEVLRALLMLPKKGIH